MAGKMSASSSVTDQASAGAEDLGLLCLELRFAQNPTLFQVGELRETLDGIRILLCGRLGRPQVDDGPGVLRGHLQQLCLEVAATAEAREQLGSGPGDRLGTGLAKVRELPVELCLLRRLRLLVPCFESWGVKDDLRVI